MLTTVLDGLDVDRSALEERVYAVLRQKILERELGPGTTLTIRNVAAALNVSPTPVRDALRRLQSDGLLRDRGRLGAEIVGLTARDVIELFGARIALETYAVREAALHRPAETLNDLRHVLAQCQFTFDSDEALKRFAALDTQFHVAIIRAAQNMRIAQMYQALLIHIQLIRLYHPEVVQRANANYREHVSIVHALEHCNPDEAAEAVNTHIMNGRDCILGMMPPDYVI